MKYIILCIISIIAVGLLYPFLNEYLESNAMVGKDANRMLVIQSALEKYRWDTESFKDNDSILTKIIGNTDWKLSAGAGCRECNPGPYYEIKPNSDFTKFEISTNQHVHYPWHTGITINEDAKISVR